MNRFRVAPGREETFLKAWRERESYLAGVPGFLRFRLLAGDGRFISCSEWRSRADFDSWTESESFAKAHAKARLPEGTLLGHPEFEGYDVALEQEGRGGGGARDAKALSRDLTDIVRLDLDEAALDRIEWRDFGKGVRLGKLAREGRAGLLLYRIAADAPRDAFAPHRHVGGEAYLVLKGVIADGFGRYPKGSFVWLPPGSRHAPWAEGETVVLVLWPEGVEVDG